MGGHSSSHYGPLPERGAAGHEGASWKSCKTRSVEPQCSRRARPASSTATQGRSQSLRNTDCVRIGGTPSELDTCRRIANHKDDTYAVFPLSRVHHPCPSAHSGPHSSETTRSGTFESESTRGKETTTPCAPPEGSSCQCLRSMLDEMASEPQARLQTGHRRRGNLVERNVVRNALQSARSRLCEIQTPGDLASSIRHGKRQPPGWKEHRLTARNVRRSDPPRRQPSLNPRENQT